MPKRTIPRRVPFDLMGKLLDYLTNRSMRERSEHYEGTLKRELMTYIEQNGEEDDSGHRTVLLDDPVEFAQYKSGKVQAKRVTGIKRQRRASTALNEDRTLKMLKDLDLLDACTEVVVVINEDAILAANYQGQITDEALEACYDHSETFAFYLETEDV